MMKNVEKMIVFLRRLCSLQVLIDLDGQPMIEDLSAKNDTNSTAINNTLYSYQYYNETCIEEFIDVVIDKVKKYEPQEAMIATIAYILICAVAFFGNGLVMVAVLRKKEMRTNRNVLITNLAISNFLLSVITLPCLWLPEKNVQFPFPPAFCKLFNAFPGSNVYCSTLTVSVMAIDRYYAVKRVQLGDLPGRTYRVIALAIFIWLFSFFLNTPLLLHYGIRIVDLPDLPINAENSTRSFSVWSICMLAPEADDSTKTIVSVTVYVTQATFLYVVPMVVLVWFNLRLTRFIRANAKQMDGLRSRASGGSSPSRVLQHRSSAFTTDSQNEQLSQAGERYLRPTDSLMPPENSITLSVGRAVNGLVSGGNAKRQGSSFSSNRIARCSTSDPTKRRSTRSRTTVLLVAMALSYAVLFLPFIVLSALLDLELVDIRSPIVHRLDLASKMLSICSICVNPFLYGFLNTNFNREFKQILADVKTSCCRQIGRCLPSRARASFEQYYLSSTNSGTASSIPNRMSTTRNNELSFVRRESPSQMVVLPTTPEEGEEMTDTDYEIGKDRKSPVLVTTSVGSTTVSIPSRGECVRLL